MHRRLRNEFLNVGFSAMVSHAGVERPRTHPGILGPRGYQAKLGKLGLPAVGPLPDDDSLLHWPQVPVGREQASIVGDGGDGEGVDELLLSKEVRVAAAHALMVGTGVRRCVGIDARRGYPQLRLRGFGMPTTFGAWGLIR